MAYSRATVASAANDSMDDSWMFRSSVVDSLGRWLDRCAAHGILRRNGELDDTMSMECVDSRTSARTLLIVNMLELTA